MRIVFMGSPDFAVPSLEALVEAGHEVVAAYCQLPRPAGRGKAERKTAVHERAEELGIAVRTPRTLRDEEEQARFRALDADLAVVAAYGLILPKAILEAPKHGCVNVHASLLPRWRGAAPIQRAILAGDQETGVTIMQMDEGLDTGPILNQLEEGVRTEDDAGALGSRLAKIGSLLLVGVLRMLPRGGVPARAQDPSAVTLAPKITAGERPIDWTRSPEEIVRWVRALSPQPGATAMVRGEPVKILTAALDHQGVAEGPPGTVVGSDARGVLVRAGSGGVRLVEVAPAGRKRMDAAAWARGVRFGVDEPVG
jgi:methionyl-tRNA formyltransferase